MFWAGDYNDDEFHEVATDMINAGYYEEDDFPYGDEDLNESEDDDDKYGRVEWDDINEIYNSTLDDAVEGYDGDPEDVNSEAMHDDFVMYLRKWNKMSNEEKDQYESIEDYFRDNINYKDYIPEADDDEE